MSGAPVLLGGVGEICEGRYLSEFPHTHICAVMFRLAQVIVAIHPGVAEPFGLACTSVAIARKVARVSEH
jgi:hypothetical protein